MEDDMKGIYVCLTVWTTTRTLIKMMLSQKLETIYNDIMICHQLCAMWHIIELYVVWLSHKLCVVWQRKY